MHTDMVYMYVVYLQRDIYFWIPTIVFCFLRSCLIFELKYTFILDYRRRVYIKSYAATSK